MKRERRPSIAINRFFWMRFKNAVWGKEVLSPLTLITAKDPANTWSGDRQFRIGYYRRQDGLNCVWMVNEQGEYEQTVDQPTISKLFSVLRKSNETDLYGDRRQPIGPLVSAA